MTPRLAPAALLLLLVPAALFAQTGYVSTFTADGAWVSSFPVGLAQEQRISFVERDATGRIYVGRVDTSHGTNQFNPNDQIAVFEADGSPALIIKGSTRLQEGLTFDSSGDLYFGGIVDGGALGDKFVYRFTPAGAEVASFGLTLNDYNDFATAPGDRIFALRNNNRDIVEFTTAGANVNSISLFGRFGRLMTINETGNSLWTYEPANGVAFPSDALYRYDLALAETGTIDLAPYGEPRAVGLEINPAGEILLLLEDARILVFAPASGALLRTIVLERLGEASNLALAADGSLLVGHLAPIASVLDIPTLDPLGLALLALALAALAAFFLARRRARA